MGPPSFHYKFTRNGIKKNPQVVRHKKYNTLVLKIHCFHAYQTCWSLINAKDMKNYICSLRGLALKAAIRRETYLVRRSLIVDYGTHPRERIVFVGFVVVKI